MLKVKRRTAERKGGRFLVNLLVNEISVVDKAANRRRFGLVKNEKGMEMQLTDDQKKSLAKWVAEVELEKGGTTASPEKLVEVSKLLGEYYDDFPAEVKNAIGSLFSGNVSGLGFAKATDKDEDAVDLELEKLLDTVVEKAGKKISQNTEKVLTDILAKYTELAHAIAGLKEMLGAAEPVAKKKKAEGEKPVKKNADDDADTITLSPTELDEIVDEAVAAVTGQK